MSKECKTCDGTGLLHGFVAEDGGGFTCECWDCKPVEPSYAGESPRWYDNKQQYDLWNK